MNLRRLSYLVQLAEMFRQGHAEDCWPQLGSHVQAIERDLGVKLVERRGAVLHGLTPAAMDYVTSVSRILQAHDAAVHEAAALAEGRTGVLRVGVTEEAATLRLAMLLRAFAERCPEARVELVEGSVSSLLAALSQHEVDLVLAASAADEAVLASEPLWEERWMVALPPGHPLAEREEVSCADLGHEHLILADPIWSPQGHDLVREAFRRKGIQPNVKALMISRSTMLALTVMGMGCTFVPESTRTVPVLRAFQAAPLVIAAVHLADRASTLARRFIEIARERTLSADKKAAVGPGPSGS